MGPRLREFKSHPHSNQRWSVAAGAAQRIALVQLFVRQNRIKSAFLQQKKDAAFVSVSCAKSTIKLLSVSTRDCA